MIRVNVNLADEHATGRADAVESAFGYMHSPMMLRSAVWPVVDVAVDCAPRGPWHPPESDIPFWARWLPGQGSTNGRCRRTFPAMLELGDNYLPGLDRPLFYYGHSVIAGSFQPCRW